MFSKKKKIKLKSNRGWWKFDILCAVLCLVCSAVLSDLIFKSFSMFELLKIIASTAFLCFTLVSNFITLLVALIACATLLALCVAWIVVFSVPVLAIYLPIRKVSKNKIKETTTFKVIEDIEYHRDFFSDLSPAEISILTNLSVNYKKDMTATLMKLYQRKLIDFDENGVIQVISNNTETLKRSEQALHDLLRSGKITWTDKGFWKKVCFQEAANDGYIKDNQSGKSLIIKLVKLAAIFILCIWATNAFLAFAESSDYEYLSDEYVMEKYDVDNPNDVPDTVIAQDPEFFLMILELVFSVIALFALAAAIILPVYSIIYAIRYSLHKVRVKRTKQGEILVEQIAAMKNFIRDFSLLSEANKEQIVLWDDFLIYAIVLEENDSIIKEISKYKKIDSRILSYMV